MQFISIKPAKVM